MRRIISALTVTAIMLAMAMTSLALPALASHNWDNSEEPRAPQCGWYENWNNHNDWWEYWCYYPSWGWEFVLWTW